MLRVFLSGVTDYLTCEEKGFVGILYSCSWFSTLYVIFLPPFCIGFLGFTAYITQYEGHSSINADMLRATYRF